MTRALLEQALNALEWHTQQTRPIHNTELAIDDLRAELAKHINCPKCCAAHDPYTTHTCKPYLPPKNKDDLP